MVLVKKALSPRAQEALELIAQGGVFHTLRDEGAMHVHAAQGNATVTLVVPILAWAELRSLIDWVPLDPGQYAEASVESVTKVPRVSEGVAVSFLDTLPIASNDPALYNGEEQVQLDLGLPTRSDQEILEQAGQQVFDLGVA